MRITPDPVNPQGQINPADFHSPSDIEKSAALQLVVKDAASTESWIQSNSWSLRWREADALFSSPPSIMMWEGTTVPRSNLNSFVLLQTINSLHPQVMNGLFYEEPPFILRPRPNQKQNTIRAISELTSIQLQEMKIRQETAWMFLSAMLFGTGIGKWGYRSYTKKQTRYVRSQAPIEFKTPIPDQTVSLETPESFEYEKIVEDRPVHTPFFENRDIRYVLVDPGCRTPDIRNAKFVIDRMYLTYRDLEKLADEEYTEIVKGKKVTKKRYDLPSKEVIKSWFEPPMDQAQHPGGNVAQNNTAVHHAAPVFQKTTADPLDEPLEVLERWDNNKVITVIQRIKCIRKEPNEFAEIPFFSVNWVDNPDAFWGTGLGRIIGMEQRLQQGINNACIDLANLIVNPMFIRARGSNIQTQQIRQRIGGIIDADIGAGANMPKSAKEALSLLEQPHIPAEIIQQIGLSEGRVEKASGASQQFITGATGGGGHSQGQAARSGTGAAGIIQATMTRIGGFAEAYIRQVYEPLLYKIHELNRDKTPIPYIRELLGDKLGADFTFDPTDFKNATAEFQVLAGSHLAQKAQMQQSMFMMMQMFETPPILEQLKIQKLKINVEELLHMAHDVSGWRNYYDIVVPMTAEDIQMMMQMNQGVQKIQGQMALNDQKFGQDQQIIDQENEARAAREMLREIIRSEAKAQPIPKPTP